MVTMKLSLPDSMQEWVESRIQRGLCSSHEDYVCDLIGKDQLRVEKAMALQQAITDGWESSFAGKLDMQEIKKKAVAIADPHTD